MELVIVSERGTSLSSPCVHNDTLYYTSTETGDIYEKSDKGSQIIGNTKGVPHSICFDVSGRMIICDFSHNALLSMSEDGEISEYIKTYDGKAFKGPNTIVSAKDGTLFFTDSGPMGETSLSHPTGSVFSIIDDYVQPLAFQCLAHPSGIALSPNEDVLFVCETMNNRILRFVQKPAGVYHCSVFYQFSGMLGPTGIAVDRNGFIYVAHFDFVDTSSAANEDLAGLITVLNPKGKKHHELKIKGTEITHMCFDPEKKWLYLTERSTKSVYRIQCAN